MTRHAVLTAIGEDRPGLVQEVSEFLLEHGGSIEDSRMANLQGQFAIVMLVSGADEALEALAAEIAALEARTGINARLIARALDQPGVVHQVANALRGLDVNIESMETTLVAAPITGAPVFSMDLI